jgi:hypothetical protein
MLREAATRYPLWSFAGAPAVLALGLTMWGVGSGLPNLCRSDETCHTGIALNIVESSDNDPHLFHDSSLSLPQADTPAFPSLMRLLTRR